MIHYVKGDATQPIGTGPKVIAHICNDSGAWGAGFVLALSKRWAAPEVMYRRSVRNGRRLGYVNYVKVAPEIVVANMIAQGRPRPDGPLVRYDALATCLEDVGQWAETGQQASIHMPRIGCGIGGGEWSVVEKIIEERLAGIDVYVYDFEAT